MDELNSILLKVMPKVKDLIKEELGKLPKAGNLELEPGDVCEVVGKDGQKNLRYFSGYVEGKCIFCNYTNNIGDFAAGMEFENFKLIKKANEKKTGNKLVIAREEDGSIYFYLNPVNLFYEDGEWDEEEYSFKFGISLINEKVIDTLFPTLKEMGSKVEFDL